MKRLLSISLVCAAAMVVLLASVVPHHHHGAEFCTEAMRHARDEGSGHPAGYCVAESEYTDRIQRDDESRCAATAHIIPPVATPVPEALFAPEDSASADCGEPIIHYESVDARTSNGLRAPPVILC